MPKKPGDCPYCKVVVKRPAEHIQRCVQNPERACASGHRIQMVKVPNGTFVYPEGRNVVPNNIVTIFVQYCTRCTKMRELLVITREVEYDVQQIPLPMPKEKPESDDE